MVDIIRKDDWGGVCQILGRNTGVFYALNTTVVRDDIPGDIKNIARQRFVAKQNISVTREQEELWALKEHPEL